MLKSLNLKDLNEKSLRKSLNFSQEHLSTVTPVELVSNHLIAGFMLNTVSEKKNSERVAKHWESALNSSKKALEARSVEVRSAVADVKCHDSYTNDKLWELKASLGVK